MMSPWCRRGVAVVSPWCRRGVAVVSPCGHFESGRSRIQYAAATEWYCYIFLRYCLRLCPDASRVVVCDLLLCLPEDRTFTKNSPRSFRSEGSFCSTWNNQRPKRTSNTFTSAGDTPGMRDACPIVAGRMRVSFCRASMVSDCSLLKSKSAGIAMFSSR